MVNIWVICSVTPTTTLAQQQIKRIYIQEFTQFVKFNLLLVLHISNNRHELSINVFYYNISLNGHYLGNSQCYTNNNVSSIVDQTHIYIQDFTKFIKAHSLLVLHISNNGQELSINVIYDNIFLNGQYLGNSYCYTHNNVSSIVDQTHIHSRFYTIL